MRPVRPLHLAPALTDKLGDKDSVQFLSRRKRDARLERQDNLGKSQELSWEGQ